MRIRKVRSPRPMTGVISKRPVYDIMSNDQDLHFLAWRMLQRNAAMNFRKPLYLVYSTSLPMNFLIQFSTSC